MTKTYWIALGVIAGAWLLSKPNAFAIPITRNPDGSLNAPPPPPPNPDELAAGTEVRSGRGHF